MAAIFGAGVGCRCGGDFDREGGDYRAANSTKNFIGGTRRERRESISFAKGAFVWRHTLLVAAGGIVGGVVGAQMAQVLPVGAARGMVMAFGRC